MRRALIIGVMICGSVVATHADWRDSYRRAIQARNRGQWADVVRFTREAIAEQPKATGERVNISGMDFVPYVPYFYLGLGLANTGDCAGALDAWRTAESQGAIKMAPNSDRGPFTKLRIQCQNSLASAGPPKPPPGAPPAAPGKPTLPAKPAGPDPVAVNAAAQTAEGAISRAENSGREVAQLAGDPLLSKVWNSESALGAADQRARETLDRARSELDTGRREPNLKRLQDAASLATTALQGFDAIRQSARVRRDELQRAAIAEAPKPLREEKPAAPPSPPPVKTDPPPATTPAPKPFSPPAALEAAARLYFSARYQEAASSLAALRYTDDLAAGHTALLRAASQYALYLIGGERDAQLLNQARQSVNDARRLAPALQPDARAFSPRFVQFFNSIR